MKKKDAVKLFGNTLSDLGKALGGKGRSAISQWPEDLTEDQTNMVIGAAVRRGIPIPDSLIKNNHVENLLTDSTMNNRRSTDHCANNE
jgi:UTP--glucose-1-phosphate uridylyltransferase